MDATGTSKPSRPSSAHAGASEPPKRQRVHASGPHAPGLWQMLLVDASEPGEPVAYLIDMARDPPPDSLARLMRKWLGNAACYVRPTAIAELGEILDELDEETSMANENEDGEDIVFWFGQQMVEANRYATAFHADRPLPAFVLSLAEGWW